jgi:hypothetical protein
MEATIVNNAARAPWNKGAIGLDDTAYGTHTLNRTKALLIDRRTKSLRAGQLLFGHSKLESTVRYLDPARKVSPVWLTEAACEPLKLRPVPRGRRQGPASGIST